MFSTSKITLIYKAVRMHHWTGRHEERSRVFFTGCGSPLSRGSIRAPATFMSALPQTRHKISPSAVVDGFPTRMWDKNHILPATWRAKEENGSEKSGREGKKKCALGPGGRAKSTPLCPSSPNARSTFNKCIGVKKKKKDAPRPLSVKLGINSP